MAAGWFETAGETFVLHTETAARIDLVRLGVGAQAAPLTGAVPIPTVSVDLQASKAEFSTAALGIVSRDCWSDGTRTVLANACGSGFDLQLEVSDDLLAVTARYRPSMAVRCLNTVARQRFSLLAGQTLVHYPALWRAGWRGRVPLHAGLLAASDGVPLLVGPSGVGKSTVIAGTIASGASIASDNLCCGDGVDCFGVAEPMRLSRSTAGNANTSRGRSAVTITNRVSALEPDRVVMLTRGEHTLIETVKPDEAARAFVAGTYSAGELRRYWQFAATLALATGRGPAHPPVYEIAARYTDRLPCVGVQVGDGERINVAQLCGGVP
ncbi:MAG TPA: hypothetical protein VGH11_04690 [Jatrophihabitans sp.]|jgi:hypothetical protein